MYSIYHIPTYSWKHYRNYGLGKIGCSTNPLRRVNQQGYSDYEILEEHTCIETASLRELELQKEYGYRVDTVPYTTSINANRISNKKRWTNNRDKQLEIAKKGSEAAILVNSKEVLQYDLQGNFIKEFSSIANAQRKTNVRHISCVCNGKRKRAGGYIWKYKITS